MLRIAICEDDSRQAEVITAFLAKYNEHRPGLDIISRVFSSGTELLGVLEGGEAFDLFLLDILMPGIDGIELAKELRAKDEGVKLIFLTSSTDYALDAFQVYAAQYILKPMTEETLFPALDKIFSVIEKREEKYFALAISDRIVKIPLSSIICVELADRSLMVTLENGTRLKSKTVRVPFATAIAALLNDDRFLSAHKSFALNMAHVEELTSNSFKMKGGVEVPIPRYRYTEAKLEYFAFLSENGVGLLGGGRQ